jgi:hypothetical protein
MKRRLRAPSPALVISLIALFVALGGTTAYASGLISGTQIVDHSLPAKKLTAAAVNALKGERGPAGPGAIEVYSSGDTRANSARHLLARTHGVAVSYGCDGDSNQIRFFLNVPHQPGHTVGINGFVAQDGVVKAARDLVIGSAGLAGRTLDLSVTVGGDDGISRIDLSGAFYLGTAEEGNGSFCGVSGLITPSAPPNYGPR